MSSDQKRHPIVLFDGVCGLCDASINFIIDHDARSVFRFAPLPSEIARGLLTHHHRDPTALTSVVLIDAPSARLYTRSSAILRIARRLNFPLPLLAWLALILLPPPLRDAGYDWIARHRYRWFGQLDACRRPTAATAARFLS